MTAKTDAISNTFIWRRVHSLMGLWLIIYLIEHLVVNSQAALWISNDGNGFVRLVNSLESLPFLHVVEIVFIGIPILIHGYWGVKRALSPKINANKSDGSKPGLPYGRNKAFKWQRLTSWILLFGIIGHVVQMRFVQMPKEVDGRFVVELKHDEKLEALAKRIEVTLSSSGAFVVASAKTPGKAMLLMVRETFKSPVMSVLYSIFVLAAAFHAFNGLWTSMITWGAMLSYRSQKAMLPICWGGVGLLAFLGLAAIWGG